MAVVMVVRGKEREGPCTMRGGGENSDGPRSLTLCITPISQYLHAVCSPLPRSSNLSTMAAAVANPQQQQSQRYVSSIPLTPARSRDVGTISTSSSRSRRHGQQQSSSSRWEDITKERLPGPDMLLVPAGSAGNVARSPRVAVDATALNASVSSLPEDHLEDLLTCVQRRTFCAEAPLYALPR